MTTHDANHKHSSIQPTPPQTTAQTVDAHYENNPFMITINGVKELFSKAQSIGITLIVLAALGVFGNIVNIAVGAFDNGDSVDSQTVSHTMPATSKSIDESLLSFGDSVKQTLEQVSPAQWAIIGIIILVVLLFVIVSALFGVYIKSVLDYTSTRVALGETVEFGKALSGGLQGFLPYLWIQILTGIKVFLWSLLFIIPGFIMAIRYSLAGMSYYATGKRGNEAIKDSIALTKDAWLTTYASYYAFNILTGSVVGSLLDTGSKIVLYRQFSEYRTSGKPKPSAHVLSWLTLILPIIFMLLAWLIIALVVLFIIRTAETN